MLALVHRMCVRVNIGWLVRHSWLTYSIALFFLVNLAVVRSVEGQQVGNQRGPLRYTMNTSSSRLESGRTFTVNIGIANPYDKPISIKSVQLAKNAIFPYVGNYGPGGAEKDPAGPFLVQPGNQLVWVFELTTSTDFLQSLFFYPTTYNVHFLIQYAVQPDSATVAVEQTVPTAEGTLLYDDITYAISILVPMHVLIIASTAGALIGALIREARLQSVETWLARPDLKGLVAITAVALLGGVAVVALSRGKGFDAAIVTDDFFGSLVFGVLVGYAGQAAVSSLLGRGPFTSSGGSLGEQSTNRDGLTTTQQPARPRSGGA